jgi:LysR family transcriptional regulator, regulator for bpeEF and oprC
MLFLEGALCALATIDDAELLVGLVANIQGTVRVTCPLSLAESRLVAMISRFLAFHPKIEIDLQLSNHALNFVSDSLDLAIRVEQPGDSRLTTCPTRTRSLNYLDTAIPCQPIIYGKI